ncbi:MAG: hypothetical protein L3J88_00270 [Gammaproteobacteria bacterium]|nr:hypothetical protein [Gammaproteobacteria bacterium]MCF6361807.1 hypothetical protein [Gammaproteobacteria bacterium]
MATPKQANLPQAAAPYLFLRITGAVLLVMLLISVWARWYGHQVSLPRYCENPQSTLQHLEKVIEEKRPAGDEARRPYIVAAKILFLLPRHLEEGQAAYLSRIRTYIQDTCR